MSTLTLQPVWAEVNQVTTVSVESTQDGIEVILQTTDPNLSQIITSTYENTYVAEITNAQLHLESGEPFNISNPTQGISGVSVASIDENSVRVVVAGVDSPPSVKVGQSHENLVLTVAAPTTPTAIKAIAFPKNRIPKTKLPR
ncbi:MAG: AMIN domain-containing protein [Scytonema sp. PMC 1069.18]|nr:AMIN domain-containing protein [Scytonema sp. PMC 1069.18]MEC4880272.1 AMIN domain-containing protein [Scytonema sp. PMC 1070.18]